MIIDVKPETLLDCIRGLKAEGYSITEHLNKDDGYIIYSAKRGRKSNYIGRMILTGGTGRMQYAKINLGDLL